MTWIVCHGSVVADLLHEAGFSSERPYRTGNLISNNQTAIQQLLQRMSEASWHSMSHSLAVQSALLDMFHVLIQDYSSTGKFHRDNSINEGVGSLVTSEHMDQQNVADTYPNWVQLSLLYANLHAADGLTVEQLAVLVGMNRHYFSTAFTRHIGCSPLAYLTLIKMRKAAVALRNGDMSITEISYSLSYANPYSFTRAFKRHYGTPPSLYKGLEENRPPISE